MKRIYFIAIACLISLAAMSQTPPTGTITYQQFYNELAPYGTWINYPGYGEVWHPSVNGDFKPYSTNGYWEHTDQGWYWDSDYSWGWGPFRYGRWFYDDSYGWLWEPGYEWSPAWVNWGDTDDHYAWAPLAPEGIVEAGATLPAFYWNMVDRKNIYDRDLSRHLLNENRLREEGNRVRMINNGTESNHNRFHIGNGPAVNEVARHTNVEIPTRTIREVHEPISDRNNRINDRNEFSVYRPTVRMSSDASPAQSRRVEAEHANPIRDNNNWPSNRANIQRENIDRLPMRKAGMQHAEPGNMHGGGRR